MIWIIGALVFLGLGIWVGLGHPGVGGRDDRVVSGRAHRLERKRLDWLRGPDRRR